uniref:Uncharacterized protein n=1 Tax=Sphenodon punctatus TaxID=8508 RepID=A0A8D0GZJ8_SPHPU
MNWQSSSCNRHDAIFGILSKVKPSYQSCTECMYSSASASAEPFGEQREKLSQAPARHTSTICTQPSLLSHGTSALLDTAPSKPQLQEVIEAKNDVLPPLLAGTDLRDEGACKSLAIQLCNSSEKPKDEPKMPVKTLLARRNSYCDKSPLGTEEAKEQSLHRKEIKQAKDLKYLLFRKDLEKPTANSYLMQHQESLIQLQKAGLVRKHTKELERLKSECVPSEAVSSVKESLTSRTDVSIPEESQELASPQVPVGPALLIPEDRACDGEKLEAKQPLMGTSQKTSTPVPCRLEHMSSFTKDFLKTICYTPSSSRSSNLTRSSSSDSIHSVHGKPGLVKQRTQEIETRLRLAGLTISSALKRSNSLAKLGSLNLSSEDLSSDMDVSTLTDSKEAKSSESSMHCESRSSLKSEDVGAKLSEKPVAGSLENTLWTGKS